MRGNNQDFDERPRPIFSRAADGGLRAGGLHVTPQQAAEDTPAPPARPFLSRPPAPDISTPYAAPKAALAAPMRPIARPVAPPPVFTAPKPGLPTVPAPVHTPRLDPLTNQTPSEPEPHDIGDMWTEQERLRLQKDWEFEQKKTSRKERRKALLGLRKEDDVAPTDTKRDSKDREQASSEPKEINFTINMPKLPKIPALPKIRKPNLPKVPVSRRQAIIGGSVVAVLALGLGGFIVVKGQHGGTGTAASTAGNNGVKIEQLDPAKQTGKPDYETVLPYGKPISDFGGWVRVSPPEKNPVFAYADKLDGVLINVSEQPIPDTFKANMAGSMESLAKQFAANDKTTAGDLTVYIGTSAQGPQSVLFTKGNLLILMKSATKVSNTTWTTYIETLK